MLFRSVELTDFQRLQKNQNADWAKSARKSARRSLRQFRKLHEATLTDSDKAH